MTWHVILSDYHTVQVTSPLIGHDNAHDLFSFWLQDFVDDLVLSISTDYARLLDLVSQRQQYFVLFVLAELFDQLQSFLEFCKRRSLRTIPFFSFFWKAWLSNLDYGIGQSIDVDDFILLPERRSEILHSILIALDNEVWQIMVVGLLTYAHEIIGLFKIKIASRWLNQGRFWFHFWLDYVFLEPVVVRFLIQASVELLQLSFQYLNLFMQSLVLLFQHLKLLVFLFAVLLRQGCAQLVHFFKEVVLRDLLVELLVELEDFILFFLKYFFVGSLERVWLNFQLKYLALPIGVLDRQRLPCCWCSNKLLSLKSRSPLVELVGPDLVFLEEIEAQLTDLFLLVYEFDVIVIADYGVFALALVIHNQRVKL